MNNIETLLKEIEERRKNWLDSTTQDRNDLSHPLIIQDLLVLIDLVREVMQPAAAGAEDKERL